MGDEFTGMGYFMVVDPDGTYGEPWPSLDVSEFSRVAFDTVDEFGTVYRHVGDLRKVRREWDGSLTVDVSDMRCFPVRTTRRVVGKVWQLRKHTKQSRKNRRKHGRR